MSDELKLLFVCLGNICRSPAAEAVMRAKLNKLEHVEKYYCDSAGTAGYHSGEPADQRMRVAADRRGYEITSLARRVYPDQDYEKFDYIFAMDKTNFRELSKMGKPGELDNKLFMMCEFCQIRSEKEVPDPYYGGEQGFENVLDILEDACEGFVNQKINVNR